MCVMFYQTKNQKPLSYSDFSAMAKKNPHGMGYMANVDGHILYKKGFFNVDAFYNAYRELMNNPKLVDIACHFRIGTGSNIDKVNCHPFPITDNKERIKKTEGLADVAIMMNGIIGNSTKEFSDTALYTMKNLNAYYNADKRFFLNFDRTHEMLFENEIHGVRFIIMSAEGTKLFGSGWTEYNNQCQVSNRYWIVKPSTYSYDYNYASYYDHTTSNTMDYYDYDAEDDFYTRWEQYRNAKRFATKKNETRHQSYIDELMKGLV